MAEFDGATCPQPDYHKDDIFKQLGRQGPIALQIHGTKRMWKEGTSAAGATSASKPCEQKNPKAQVAKRNRRAPLMQAPHISS